MRLYEKCYVSVGGYVNSWYTEVLNSCDGSFCLRSLTYSVDHQVSTNSSTLFFLSD